MKLADWSESSLSGLLSLISCTSSFKPADAQNTVQLTQAESIIYESTGSDMQEPSIPRTLPEVLSKVFSSCACELKVRKPHVLLNKKSEIPKKFIACAHDKKVTVKIERLNTPLRFKFFINACRVATLLREQGVLNATPHISQFYVGAFLNAKQVFHVLGVDSGMLCEKSLYGMQCQETAGLFSLTKFLEMWVNLLRRKVSVGDISELEVARDKFEIFLRSVLFQILYTLHCIQIKCPNVRHNDLHPENIVLQPIQNPVDLTYEVSSGRKFTLYANSKNYLPSIIDFGWATNDDKTLPVCPNTQKNHYVDIHRFVNGVLHILQPLPRNCLSDSMRSFLKLVVSDELRVPLNPDLGQFGSIWSPDSAFMIEADGSWIYPNSPKIGKPLVERTTPARLLTFPLFNIYRTQKPRAHAEQLLFSCVSN